MDLNEIDLTLRRSLSSKFPLFEESHKTRVITPTRDICIGYYTIGSRPMERLNTTYFDLQISDSICYILHLELENSQRGKGVGWNLYEAIHSFSKDIGLERVRQTPSGWTGGKVRKSRREYLVDRGYIPFSNSELDFILNNIGDTVK